VDSTQPASLPIRLKGGEVIAADPSLRNVTTYVLAEQEEWFEAELGFIRRFLKPGMVMADIGANVGVYAAAAAEAVTETGLVVAVEPVEESFGRLGHTLRLARQAVLVKAALSDAGGQGEISLGPGPEYAQLGGTVGRREKVRVTTLDGLASEGLTRPPDLIKIDAEGAEAQIIAGGKRLLDDCSPVILAEYRHGEKINAGLVAALEAKGFDLYGLLPGLNLLVPLALDAADGFQLNIFALRPDRARQLRDLGLLAQSPRAPGGFSGLLRGFSKELPAVKLAHQALTHPDPDPAAAWAGLLAAEKALSGDDRPFARALLARLFLALGQRESAVAVLGGLLETARQGEIHSVPEEALPADPTAVHLPDGHGREEALTASIIIGHERARAMSSLFGGPGSLPALDWLVTTRFATPEMRRRRVLMRLRTGLASHPGDDPVLSEPCPGHLNAHLWRPHSPLIYG